MDEIRIEGMELFCSHGVFPEENVLGQKFIVSAILYTDTRKAGLTDQISDSVNYGQVCEEIAEMLTGHTFKLLERACEYVCERLLLLHEGLRKVTLEIKKPWAPIKLPLENVAVKITRQWHKVYLSVGSNMGDKESYLDGAVKALKEEPDIRLKKVSGWISTKPYGYMEQDDFLNGCIEIETLKTPRELLCFIHRTEHLAGRERLIRWGPRTLDIDILFYGKLVIEEDDLVIPHKEIEKREFVLKPLCEIAPNFRHPVSMLTVENMYELLDKGLK